MILSFVLILSTMNIVDNSTIVTRKLVKNYEYISKFIQKSRRQWKRIRNARSDQRIEWRNCVVPKPMKGEERSLLTGVGTWESINTIIGNNDDITIPSTEEFGNDMTLVVKYLVDNKLIEMGEFFVGVNGDDGSFIIGRFYRDEDGLLFGSCMILGCNPGSFKIVCCDHGQYTAY